MAISSVGFEKISSDQTNAGKVSDNYARYISAGFIKNEKSERILKDLSERGSAKDIRQFLDDAGKMKNAGLEPGIIFQLNARLQKLESITETTKAMDTSKGKIVESIVDQLK